MPKIRLSRWRYDDFSDIGGDDGDFGKCPERHGDIARECIATGLCQVPAAGDGEPGAQRLQHDGHQVGQKRHREKRIAEFRAAGERRRPVAGVHVADRHQIARPGKRHHPAQLRIAFLGVHRTMHVGKAEIEAVLPPASIGFRFDRVHGVLVYPAAMQD